ncbi:MAG: hypothetical protein NWE94_01210 [Candidatus Bathyarchaeota archaeon]|nr:hypothetical protein [Candidatus Bathyarchaeota archaeon]
MQLSRNRTIATAITLFLTLSIAASLALPVVNAHTPPWTVKTYAYVTATPNPAGVNQPVAIVFWLNWPPPTAAGNTGDRWQGFKIEVTKPDGAVDTLGPFVSDPVGSSFTSYTPTQVGEYKVKFTFPGQVLQRAGYTGLPGSNSDYVNDTFAASTAETTFTVQETPVPYWTQPPLPTSYWERPIDSMNTNWHVIASNWLGQSEFGVNYLRYQKYGRAPDSAHVLWTKPISFGGVVGGPNVGTPDMTFYSGTAYQYRFPNPLIMYGRLYYPLPLANSPTGGGYTCVDLRTGERIWTTELFNQVTFGQFLDFESPNQHGVNPNGYLWLSTTIRGTGILNPTGTYPVTGGTTNSTAVINESGWMAIDAMTGRPLFNYTGVPSGTRSFGPNGEWLINNIGRQNTSAPYTYLWQWNSTKYPGLETPGTIVQWLPGLRNINMSMAYDWNVTLSQPLPAGTQTAIVQVIPGDLIFGRSSALQFTSSTGGAFGTPDPYTLWVVNLNKTRGPIGQVLWIKNYTGSNDMTILIGQRDQETYVFTKYYKETMQWSGYSLLTGEKLWGPTPSENAFNFYGGTTGLTAPYAIGYGRLYSTGYGGTLYCYDLKTGKTVFTYGNDPNDPKNCTMTPNTVYGNYPYQVAAVGDGKVYMISSEHSLGAPPFFGAEVRCVNATTGEEIWKLVGMCNWQEVALADGYFVYLNYNDMQIYCIGPGPSATTVTASPSVTAQGGSVLITGTVTDQSPNKALKGTAAIADEDQGAWMNYMVMKNVVCPNVKGVEVTLDTLDPNGNFIHIGTVTTDSSGLFKKLWTPEVPGEYTIIATFAGSKSYGPSYAETAIGITDAPPSPTPMPEYPQPIDHTMTIIGTGIAIILVVVIIGLLILRKK